MRWLGSFLLLTVLTTLNAVNPSASTSRLLTNPATTHIPPSMATVTQPTQQITTLNKNNNVASSPSSTVPSLSTPLSSTQPSSTPPSSATSAAAAAAAAASPAAIENTSSNAVATSATNPASTPANTNTTTPANTNTTTPANTNTTPTNTNTTNPTNTTTTPAYEANITPSPSTNATELPNNASITLQTANSSTVTPKSPLSSSFSSPSSSTFPSATPGVSRDAATVNGTDTTPPSASEAASSSVTTAGGDINTNNTNNRFDASTAKTATTQDASEGGVPVDDRGIDDGSITPPPSTARPSKTEAVTEPDSSDSGHQAAGAERPGGPRHNVRTVLLAVGCSCLVLLVSAMLLYSKRRTRNKSWYVHNDHQVLENPCYENGCHDNGGNSNGGCHDNPAMEAIAGGPSAAAAAAAADGWPDEAWGCDTGPPLRPPGRATPARVVASPSVGVDAWVVPLDNVSSGDDPLAGLMQDTRL
ncbi:mucin-2-like isoform X2 [Lethenteron reissneri]|uniref:mucin-2-like isoform X2 n=1 Tax=Lethenteron reissneri TaxID=7753 RepID=UPI002AB7A39C|nr:mucin-2-like isoform X2 [Lethenteron reissneri]